METEKDQVTEPEAVPELNLGGVLDQVQDIIGALVVLERYTIEADDGQQFTFRPVLTARKQMEVARRAQEVVEIIRQGYASQQAELQKMVSGPDKDNAKAMMSVFRWIVEKATTDKALEDALEAAWFAMHPEIKEALNGRRLFDAFALEDIVTGALPFFARSGTKLLRLIRGEESPALSTTGSKTPAQPSASI